ncbi:MBL fold metallo-hydrolase [Negadavirga shengliensis]|uniref:MBL fold metallo-hydrolase n=1 Tax=Negadavirga shengliensis TaxID=1389218 RepID=A0ABV9SZB0_9BACT
MKITFLGTGTSQGVPVIGCSCEVCNSLDYRDKRLRSSLHIETEGKSIVIDTGPDFRSQMLRESISRLDAVVYTHEHKDHTAGLDDIRPFNFKHQIDIPIYGTPQVIQQLMAEFSYIFVEKKYPGIPRVVINEIENRPFEVKGVPFTPIRVMHHKLPVFGYRIHDFTYITDANQIPQEELKKMEGTKVLVLNALQTKPHISHFTLQEALDLVDFLKPQQAYFTHVSHRLGLHRKVEENLPGNVALAYDGLKISL